MRGLPLFGVNVHIEVNSPIVDILSIVELELEVVIFLNSGAIVEQL